MSKSLALSGRFNKYFLLIRYFDYPSKQVWYGMYVEVEEQNRPEKKRSNLSGNESPLHPTQPHYTRALLLCQESLVGLSHIGLNKEKKEGEILLLCSQQKEPFLSGIKN